MRGVLSVMNGMYSFLAGVALSVTATVPGLPASQTPASNVAWLVFVDDLHINFTNTGRLHTLLRAIVDRVVSDGDSIAILSPEGGGPSRLRGEPASDRQLLDQQIDQTSGAALRLPAIRQSMTEPLNEVSYRMHVSLSTIHNAVERLARAEDRKTAIIYVSNGYVYGSTPSEIANPAVADPFSATGTRFTPEDVRSEIAVLIHHARRANVRIFAIDPRSMPGALTMDPGSFPADWNGYVASTRNSLRLISERTGGFALVDEDPVGALPRITSAMQK